MDGKDLSEVKFEIEQALKHMKRAVSYIQGQRPKKKKGETWEQFSLRTQ